MVKKMEKEHINLYQEIVMRDIFLRIKEKEKDGI